MSPAEKQENETAHPVERAAEFIWDYIHGNWGTYYDVQDMAAAMAEAGLINATVEWGVKLTNDEVVKCPTRADADLFLVGYPKGRLVQRATSGPWAEVWPL